MTDIPLLQDPVPPPLVPPAAPAEDPVWANVRAVREERDQREQIALRNVLDIAAKADPEVEAERQRAAKQFGVPVAQLPIDMEAVRAHTKQRQLDDLRASLTDPGLRKRMLDVGLVQLTHDDGEGIKALTGVMGWLRRTWSAGTAVNDLGDLYARQAIARATGSRTSDRDLDHIKELEHMQVLGEHDSGVLDEGMKLFAQMAKPALAAAGAGWASASLAGLGGPISAGAAGTFGAGAAMFAHSAAVEFGHQYHEIYQQLRDAQVPEDEAHSTAMGLAGAYAVAAGLIDTVSLGPTGKAAVGAAKAVRNKLLGIAGPTMGKAGVQWLKATGHSLGSEVLGEGAQDVLGAIAQHAAGAVSGVDTGPTAWEALVTAGQTMWKTAKGMAVLAPIAPTIHYAADLQKVQQAKKTGEFFDRLAEVSKTSKLAERSGDRFAQLVQAQTDEANATVYIEAPKLEAALAQLGMTHERFAQVLPDAADQLAKGVDDVEISTGDFAAHVARTDLFPLIKNSARFGKQGYSLDRAEEWVAEQKANVEATKKRVVEAQAKVQDWDAQAARVEQRFLGEVQKDARITPANAKYYAFLHRAHVEAMAAHADVTPEAWDAANKVTIEVPRLAAEPTAGTLSQDETTHDNQTTARGFRPRERVRVLGTESAPRYGTAGDASARVVGVHFSREPRSTVSGEFYGTGFRGGEARRVAGDPVLGKRVHFYVDEGQGIAAEPGVGQHAHAVNLDNVYSTQADPLGLLHAWLTKRQETGSADFNELEQAIVDAGFDGIYVPKAQGEQGVAVLLGPKHTAAPLKRLERAADGRLAQSDTRPMIGGFYSALQGYFRAWPTTGQRTAAEWLATLTNAARAGAVKTQELIWTGVDDLLKAAAEVTPAEKFSSQELLEFVRKREVTVEEVAPTTKDSLVKYFVVDQEGRDVAGPFDSEEQAQHIADQDEGDPKADPTALVDDPEEQQALDEIPGVPEFRTPKELLDFALLQGVEHFNRLRDTVYVTPEHWQHGEITAERFEGARANYVSGGIEQGMLDAQFRHYREAREFAKANPGTTYSVSVHVPKLADVLDYGAPAAKVARLASASGGSIGGTLRTRTDYVFADEAKAQEFVEATRAWIEENTLYTYNMVEERGSGASLPFDQYTTTGPFTGYVNIALVRSDTSTGYTVPKEHSFGEDNADDDRLVHARVDYRSATLDTGEVVSSVMHVEEIQSDYADALREQGKPFEGDADARREQTAVNRERQAAAEMKANAAVRSLMVEAEGSEDQKRSQNSMHAAALEYAHAQKNLEDLRRRQGDLDPSPFVHSTEAWTTLMVKHLLMRAASANQRFMSFATGKQNAALYTLDEAVKQISWKGGGLFRSVTLELVGRSSAHLRVDALGRVLDAGALRQAKGKPLAAVIGKDLAEKVMADWFQSGTLEASELTSSGRGMRKYYGDGRGFNTGADDNPIVSAKGKTETAILPGIVRSVVATLPGKNSFVQVRLRGHSETNFAVDLSPEAMEFLRTKGLPLFQDKRGEFDPATNRIFLNPDADPTTLLHELSHFWLTSLFRAASNPQATPAITKLAHSVLTWFGVADIAAWNALGFAQQKKRHEAWAYQAELSFFGVGKSPTDNEDERRAFRAFGRWTRSVYRKTATVLNATYKREFGVDLPSLTPDVRAVFDRMVASEDAIAAAQTERAMDPLLAEQPADMSEAHWQELQEQAKDTTDRATDELQHMTLQAMKWVGTNMSRVAKMLQRETRKLRTKIEAEERAKVEAEPIYRAEQVLRHGMNADGVTSTFKLNLAEFIDRGWFGKLTSEEASAKLGTGPSGMLAANGMPLDLAAQTLGFDTGETLVRALLDAPPIASVVQQRADARMLAEHSDLTDPKKVQRAIEHAVHNDARAKLVAAELRWLSKTTSPLPLMVRAAKAHAEEVIGETPIGKVKAHEHARAETQHRREALRMLGKGDHERARSHKRSELLESQMEREALRVQAELEAAQKLAQKLFRSDKKLAAAREVDYVAIARYLVAAFGMTARTAAPETYIAQLKQYNPALFERLTPILDRAQAWASDALAEGRVVKSWRDLTVDEFRDLHDSVKALWQMSAREHQFRTEQKLADLEDVAGEVTEQLAAVATKKPEPVDAPESLFKDLKAGAHRLLLLAQRPEHWAFRRDGAKTGPLTRYFWQKVRKAVDRYTALRNKVTKAIEADVRALRPKLKGGLIEFRDANGKLLHVFGKKNGGFGHSELVAALLHIGNAGNLRRLLVGRSWGSYDKATKQLDTRAWDAFLGAMVADGYVTKDVMDFVQRVWDRNEEIKPLAQEAHKELFGYRFDEVEATPVSLPGVGTFRGGYMPAKLDASAPTRGRLASLEEVEGDHRKQFASTGRGFSKNRVEDFAEPLLLDLMLVPSHVDQVLRFSFIQPAIRDVERLAKHRGVAAALEAEQPGVWQNLLLPWLQVTASQSLNKAGKSTDLDGILRFARSSVGLSTMFANIGNVLQQVTGPILAALKVPPRYVAKGLWRLITERRDLYTDVAKLSPFMENRQKNQTFDALDQISEMTEKRSALKHAQTWVRKHGYFMQSAFQNAIDAAVWSGAYQHSLDTAKRGASEEDAKTAAIEAADAAVRMTQGSFDPTDAAPFEAGTPFYRLWTMYTGYFNMLANLQGDQFAKMAQASGWRGKFGVGFAMYVLGFAAPALLADAITRTVRGQWDDEDEDGDLDVLTFDYLFMGQLRAAIAEVPVAGPALLAPALNAFDNQPYNDRMTTSPAVTALERAFGGSAVAVKTALGLRTDRKGNLVDVSGTEIRDVMTLLGIFAGLPLGGIGARIGYGYDVGTGAVTPSDGYDLARGVVSGAVGKSAERAR